MQNIRHTNVAADVDTQIFVEMNPQAEEVLRQLVVVQQNLLAATQREQAEVLRDLTATQRLLLEHLKKPRYENGHNCDVSLHSCGEVCRPTRSPQPSQRCRGICKHSVPNKP